MFWMMNDWNRGDRRMGPRGPMRGHRGYGWRGIGPGSLFLLPALMFGGWMIVAAIGGLIGVAFMVLGSVFSSLAYLTERIFSGAFAGGSLAIGILLGLVMFFWMKKRNAGQGEG